METSTSIVKRDESLVRLSRVVDERGKVDVSTLSEADRKRCREITKNIKNVFIWIKRFIYYRYCTC